MVNNHFFKLFSNSSKSARLLALVIFTASIFWSALSHAQTLISISNPPAAVNATAVGDTQFWPQAGTVNGVPISLRATVTSLSAGDTIRLFTSGDNPVVRANTGTLAATVVWEVFNAVTGAPITADPNFLITDIDGNNGNPIESVSAACAGLTSYTVNGNFIPNCNANNDPACATNIQVTESGGNILGEGTQNQNGGQQEGFIQYSWNGVTEWTVNYFATTRGRWFVHDADGDVPFDANPTLVNLVDMATIKGVSSTSLTSPAVGEQITFEIEMSNAGPANATGGNLIDTLPIGLNLIMASATSGTVVETQGAPDTVAWSNVDVPVGGIEVLTIVAEVEAPAVAGNTLTNETTTALANESVCSSRDVLTFSFVVAETPDPSLEITKSVSSATSFSQAGDTITYSYEVVNTGNINIDNVVPTDSGPTFGGDAATNGLAGFTPSSALLAPGDSQIFTATYLLAQADVDNMAADADPLTAIENTASATGDPAGGESLPTVADSSVETGFSPEPSLSILKEVSADTAFSAAGDTITYQYTITNTGNITIDAVMPTDPGPTFNGAPAAGTLSAFSPASVSLAPNAMQVFTATYQLQQADVDNMAAAAAPLTAIDNAASATGDPVGDTALPPVTESEVETGFAPVPSMTIAKSVGGATTFSQAGDTITYEYLVENTGNVTISGVAPTDNGPTFNGVTGTNSLSGFTPSSATIAPDDPPVLFTATYVLSQDDIDNMFAAADPTTAIDNVASASGTPVGGVLPPVPNSEAETGFSLDSELTLSKTAGAPTIGLGTNASATDAGDTISYSFDVTNSGDVTIDALVISDSGPTFNGATGTGTLSAISCPLSSLSPDQMTTCTAIYTLSQGDVDNAIVGGVDAVENSAEASGEDPNGDTVDSPTDTANQTIAADSSIEITKSASAPTIANGADPTIVDPGDSISYQLQVDNTGNTTLSNVLVSDSIATVTCPATTNLGAPFVNDGTAQLAVGDGIVCAAEYVLQQTDLDAGGVQNTADAESTDPTGAPINDSDTVDSGFTQRTSVALVKSATPLPDPANDGDPITYTFMLTNTGNVSLSSPQVTDPICETPASPLTFTNGFISGDAGVAGEMEAGETWVFECVYTIDQDDVDAGEVANTAVGTGTPPPGSGLADPTSTASNLADAEQNAAISLVKSSSLPTVANGSLTSATDEGDTVSYTFEVENTGNVTLNNVTVTDPLITAAPNNGSISCPAGISSMAPGDVVVCTATYALTLDDVNAGMVANTANTTGTPPPSVPPIEAPEADSSNSVIIPPMPELEVEKSVAALTAPLQENDVITYTFEIENTGNVTINGILPVDSGPTFNGAAGSNSLSAFTPVTADLDPGQTQIFTATYTLSQADIDNIAAAADPLTAIDNSATAQGTPENGNLPPVTPSTTETGAAPDPQVELIKSSTPPAVVAAGEVITYTFNLENTGNVTIASPIVDDPQCAVPASPLNFASGFVSGDTGATPQALDVGETWIFSCTYPITQADINAGTVQNTATGGGQDPSGQNIDDDSDSDNPGDDTGADDDPTNTPLAQTSSWTVTKSTSSVPTMEGDTLVYQFEVENTGNVDITSITVNDAKCAAAPVLVSGDVGNDLVLSPPETFVYECTSIPVTQVEVDDGMVDNEVDVIGSVPPTAPLLPVAEDNISTPIAPAPALEIDKSSAAPTVGLGDISTATDPGDTIVYTFDIENTGNVTISNLSVTDPGPTFGGNAGAGVWSGVSCPATTLLPTQTTSCTATYTLAQDDIDAAIAAGPNSVANTATATGDDPDNGAVASPADQELTSIDSEPALVILKDAASPSVDQGPDPTMTDPGDTIEFTITVENTGNTTLTNVLVQDSLTSVSCPDPATPSGNAFTNAGDPGSLLEVGDTVVCIATYIIDQDDINAGQVINTASVASTDPSGELVDGVAEETSPFTQRTSVALTKTASTLPTIPPPLPNDIVTFTFVLENTGNVSLSSPQIEDLLCTPTTLTATVGLDPATDVGSDGVLDAGESWTFSCDYPITQEDITAGEISNTATGSGTPPADSGLDEPSSTSSALVVAEQNASITLDKIAGVPTTVDGDLATATDVGDTITYTFNVANTGNLPFENVTIDDPLITDPPNSGAFSCELDTVPAASFTLGSTELPINQSITCEAVYTLTQEDVDAGLVSNMATAIGDPPGVIPPAPEAESGAMVPIDPEPSLSVDKSASAIPANVAAGTVITYSYEIENTGNVTIDNVAPIDLGPTFNGVPGTNALSNFSPVSADLAPGEIETFTATYVISQQDLDNMAAASAPATAIDNEATADGEPIQGLLPPVDPSTVETGVEPDPSLELIKTSSISAPVSAGSIITYSFTLNNNGNVTISNPSLDDPMCQSPVGPLSFTRGFVSGDSGAIPQALDVGETWLFECEYTITQTDLDAGTVQNTATASGQDPSGETTEDDSDSGNPGNDTGADDDPTNTTLPRAPAWTIEKSTTSIPTAVGDTLTYSFVLSNTGNTSISAITVSDAKCVGGVAILDASTDINADGILSPAGAGGSPAAEQWTYSCESIPVTQGEIDNGNVINNVTADGAAPGGGLGNATDQLTTPVPQTPSMSLVKSAGIATLNNDGSFDQVFNFELKNTGNITLDTVSITDNIPAQFGACFAGVVSSGIVSIIDGGEAGGSLNAALGTSPVIASIDELGVQDSLVVTDFIVRFDPNAAACSFPDPAENTASGGSDQANDVSDNGTDPDAANPDDGGTPTPFVPPVPSPELGVAKSAAVLMVNQGFTFDAEYTLLLQNTGDVDLSNLELFDDIESQLGNLFDPSTASETSGGVISPIVISVVNDVAPIDVVLPTANSAYTGASENLFDGNSGFLGVGDTIEVRFSVRIDPTRELPLAETFENSAQANATAPGDVQVSDLSNQGVDPSVGSGGAGDPTIITLDDVSALPITLGQFQSRLLSNGEIEVRWQTQTEVANLGFNLYGRVDDQWQRLNAEVIPGQGDSIKTVEYSFQFAANVEFLALSDIDAYGSETIHGPFSVGRIYGANSVSQVTDWSESILRRESKQQSEVERRRQAMQQQNEARRQRRAAGEN